jgi:hypothetical protein
MEGEYQERKLITPGSIATILIGWSSAWFSPASAISLP